MASQLLEALCLQHFEFSALPSMSLSPSNRHAYLHIGTCFANSFLNLINSSNLLPTLLTYLLHPFCFLQVLVRFIHFSLKCYTRLKRSEVTEMRKNSLSRELTHAELCKTVTVRVSASGSQRSAQSGGPVLMLGDSPCSLFTVN